MKFDRYITESRGDTSIVDMVETLRKNCMPYLKDVAKINSDVRFLWSGRNDDRDIFKADVRTDRRPKDMQWEYHEAYDYAFELKFGFNARSNALFVTGRYNSANSYGRNVYMIFPIGKYRYVWSDEIKDLYDYSSSGGEGYVNSDLFEVYIDELIDDNHNNWQADAKKEWEEKYKVGQDGVWRLEIGDIKEQWDLRYQSQEEAIVHFSRSIDKNIRLKPMVRSEYIAKINKEPIKYLQWFPGYTYDGFIRNYKHDLKDEWWADTELRNEFYAETIEGVAKKTVAGYSNKDIVDAIRSGNEIMLNCKSYYAVKEELYGDALRNYFKANGPQNVGDKKIIDWYMKNNGRLPKQIPLFSTISNDEVLRGNR